MTNRAKIAALAAAFLTGNAVECLAADPRPVVVEIESPLASPHPLQGYLRQTGNAAPSPAVVLLHSCNGNWAHLDERWGKRIASWGYVVLTVDSLGPRGLTSCGDRAPDDLPMDAYRALNFLVRESLVDPARIAVLGFANGGRVAIMSVEHGGLEQTSPNKFRAAVAFYPPCQRFRGDVTVPTLIMTGERDDLNSAQACRDLVDGRDEWGMSRPRGEGAPIKLIVYPDAYHGFDAPSLKDRNEFRGHHREFNQSAMDQSAAALREFLDATVGQKVQ